MDADHNRSKLINKLKLLSDELTSLACIADEHKYTICVSVIPAVDDCAFKNLRAVVSYVEYIHIRILKF